MAEVPETTDEERVTVIDDGVFEEEFYLDAADAGDFLITLGEQLKDGEAVTVTGDDWELPFVFDEPVELEVEFEGYGDGELEIELELDGATETDESPDVA